MLKQTSLLIALCLAVFISAAQKPNKTLPFSIRLQQMEMVNLPALQSFAYATWQGKWLLIGGRIDGLHRRQPFASFDEAGQNKFIYVVDPVKKKVWKQSLDKFPVSMAEQFKSTNMEFCQMENKLIVTGGYGYSKLSGDHITYPNLSIIKVDRLINAIINAQPLKDVIVQITDERMAVTGGRLARLGDTLLLAGGQRFDGRYNPMGPDHGPGFSQVYSNEIRKFTIEYENDVPVIKHYTAINDSINLHRRDYNLVPQIYQNGELGYTMYSGVFQYNADLPFTNFVDIRDGGYKVNNGFNQQLNHYHSAVLPLYDKAAATMYSIFFGGIAQFYPDVNGKLVNDKDVPFTKTISVVIRKGDKTEETYLPIQMPGYLGTAAEFFFAPSAKMYKEGIADAGFLQGQETLIGYIVGGINSSAKNIFWDNEGKESKASAKVIMVFAKRLK
jgi:hypothetical protein